MWYLLDKDNNGCVTLEEFDYDGAQDERLLRSCFCNQEECVKSCFCPAGIP